MSEMIILLFTGGVYDSSSIFFLQRVIWKKFQSHSLLSFGVGISWIHDTVSFGEEIESQYSFFNGHAAFTKDKDNFDDFFVLL